MHQRTKWNAIKTPWQIAQMKPRGFLDRGLADSVLMKKQKAFILMGWTHARWQAQCTLDGLVNVYTLLLPLLHTPNHQSGDMGLSSCSSGLSPQVGHRVLVTPLRTFPSDNAGLSIQSADMYERATYIKGHRLCGPSNLSIYHRPVIHAKRNSIKLLGTSEYGEMKPGEGTLMTWPLF